MRDHKTETPTLRPRAMGIALGAARLKTIHPQPHDMPCDLILTETGSPAERDS